MSKASGETDGELFESGGGESLSPRVEDFLGRVGVRSAAEFQLGRKWGELSGRKKLGRAILCDGSPLMFGGKFGHTERSREMIELLANSSNPTIMAMIAEEQVKLVPGVRVSFKAMLKWMEGVSDD